MLCGVRKGGDKRNHNLTTLSTESLGCFQILSFKNNTAIYILLYINLSVQV